MMKVNGKHIWAPNSLPPGAIDLKFEIVKICPLGPPGHKGEISKVVLLLFLVSHDRHTSHLQLVRLQTAMM